MRKIILAGVVLASLGVLLTTTGVGGCGGNGGSGGTCSFSSLDPVSTDVEGTWAVSELTNSSNPDCDNETKSYNLVITVSGNTISAYSEDLGTTFTGEISGNQIRWDGSFSDGSGTSTILCAKLTINSSTSVTGTATFEYEEEGWGTCSGTTTITATKIS